MGVWQRLHRVLLLLGLVVGWHVALGAETGYATRCWDSEGNRVICVAAGVERMEEPRSLVSRILEENRFLIPVVSGVGFQLLQDYRRDLVSAPFLHALITGVGANYLYFNRDQPYWKRVVERAPPEGVLDSILPLITYGYAGFEIYDSLMKGSLIYLLHGGSMFLVLWMLDQNEQTHLTTDALMMETSSIFLNLRDVHEGFRLAFAASFYFYRWLIFPYEWGQYMKAVYWDGDSDSKDTHLNMAIAATGTIFNSLNVYWGAFIMKKLARRFL